ncbi:MAG: tRNA (N6-isopentenyl adenosine(37)-C2)-methylthiotransferase MiaB [Planctomycetota bacterium]
MSQLAGKKVHIRTFGCQMNVYDADVARTMLEQAGCVMVAEVADADAVVLVTCSVRAHAENRVFSLIGALGRLQARQAGRPVVGIMGCTAQKLGREYIDRFPGVSFVIGTQRAERLVPMLAAAFTGACGAVDTAMERQFVPTLTAEPVPGAHAAFVAVAVGCSRACAYCIVPQVRGRMNSRPPADILAEAARLAGRGVVDLTLLGQNIDAYGRDIHYAPGLAGLLADAAAIPGLRRINFVTSHPADLHDDIIAVIRDHPVIAPFFHLPPQSGSNRVLAAMRRGYTREYYLDLVARIRDGLPRAEFAGDFIVGFPGETEADFDASARLLAEVGFQQAYIFKYSPRENTPAAGLPDDVPLAEKKRRNNALLDLQEGIQLARHRSFVGREVAILVEGPSKNDQARFIGRTATNFRVIFDPAGTRPGDLVAVRIREVTPLTLYGDKV